jgi:hypothetical protein
MKKQMAFGAAVAALLVTGVAHADAGAGYVGLNYNSNEDTDSNSWGVDGAALLGTNIQVDGGYSRLDDLDANSWNVGGHLFSRNDNWLWGVFAGFDSVDGGSGDGIDEWTIAGQTQFYMDRVTLSGDLSYSTADVGFLGDVTTTQLAGEARFFATDNFSLQANLGLGQLDTDLGDGDFTRYGAGAEWKLDAAPVSFIAGVAELRSRSE